MLDDELLRYSRHILLEQIGVEGQNRLNQANAIIIGAGGLGSPAAMYLACAGVGSITLIDHDSVDLTNLQRQIIHRTERVGQTKVLSAASTLQELNPHIRLHTHAMQADSALLDRWVPGSDVVLDCSDNFATRQIVNQACAQHGVPLVWAAALQFAGQMSVFDPRNPNSPCYACVFPKHCPPPETRCSTMGVFAPLVGIMGAMQASEALKLLLNQPTLTGKLMLIDALPMEWNTIQLVRQPDCTVCGANHG
jgi:molybdopterin-synthase adenylyltransferase